MGTHVWAVAGGKGGAGRTTTAINVGTVLTAEGYDTVVVDAALAMANVGGMLSIDSDTTLHDVLAGEAIVSEALTRTEEGVWVVPGDRSIESYGEADPSEFGGVIDALGGEFDVVLVDTSAAITHETVVPLGLADATLLVSPPTGVAVQDTRKIARLVERVDGSVMGAALTRVKDRTDVGPARERLNAPVLGIVPEHPGSVPEQPLALTVASSPAAQAYRGLTRALIRTRLDGEDPRAVETVVEDAWFQADGRAVESTVAGDGGNEADDAADPAGEDAPAGAGGPGGGNDEPEPDSGAADDSEDDDNDGLLL
jgi:septum site-determining protein MinD